AVAEWYRYRIVACLVTSSRPGPLKTAVWGSDALNLLRVETFSRWCGVVVGRENPAVYLQVDDHVHPGIALQQFQVKKKQDLLHVWSFTIHLPSWDMNEQMSSIFSSFSDEWSRDLKSVQVLKQLSCRDESPDPSMSKIVLRDLIISSNYYKEEEAKELLEVITAERLETEQQQKLEQQEQLSIEKLRLEIELSRNAYPGVLLKIMVKPHV
ncbi:hypothetical protein TNCV_5003041, partial [Trichonephila clavipes]